MSTPRSFETCLTPGGIELHHRSATRPLTLTPGEARDLARDLTAAAADHEHPHTERMTA